MKKLKNTAVTLCLFLLVISLCGCSSFSLLKPEESTTKKAFDEQEFDEEFYRTSVAQSTTETTEPETEESETEKETQTASAAQTSATVTEKITELTSVISTAVSETVTEAAHTLPVVTTTKKTVVDTKREEKKTKTDYKYGVVKIDTVATYYDIYSDGSKVKSDQKSYTSYDYSKYKATTSELLAEAKANKITNSATVTDLINEINSYRRKAGQPELTVSDSLCTAAGVRATEMAYSAKLSSTRPDGRKYSSVLNDLDIEYKSAIELTAKNSSGAAGAASAWNNKSGSVITSSEYKKIGAGIATGPEGDTYWCVVFTD